MNPTIRFFVISCLMFVLWCSENACIQAVPCPVMSALCEPCQNEMCIESTSSDAAATREPGPQTEPPSDQPASIVWPSQCKRPEDLSSLEGGDKWRLSADCKGWRLGKQLRDPEQISTDAQISPDGTMIAYGAWDDSVRVWTINADLSLKPTHQMKGHTDKITVVRFGPLGRLIISGSRDRTVRIWDRKTGTLLHTLRGHFSAVLHIAVDPKGRWIASTSLDQLIQVWDIQHGKLMYTLCGGKLNLDRLKYSPDGQLKFSPDGQLLTAAVNEWLVVWESATGRQLYAPKENFYRVLDFDYHPKKPFLAVSFPNGLYAVDTTTWKEKWISVIESNALTLLRYSPSGDYLIASYTLSFRDEPAHLVILDGNTHEPLYRNKNFGGIYDLSFLPGTTIFASGSSEYFSLFDVAANKSVEMSQEIRGYVPRFGPFGKLLLTNYRGAQLWKWPSGERHHAFFRNEASRLAFHPKTNELVIAEARGLQMWDIHAETPRPSYIELPDYPAHFALHPKGTSIAVSTDTSPYYFTPKKMYLLDGHTGAIQKTLIPPNGPLPINGLAFALEGQVLASSHEYTYKADHSLYFWDPTNGTLRDITLTADAKIDIDDITVSPDGKTFLTTSTKKDRIDLWDAATGKNIATHDVDIKFSSLARYHPSGTSVFFTVSQDNPPKGGVQRLDLATGAPKERIMNHEWDVSSFALSRDGNYLATAYNSIKIWDFAQSKVVCTVENIEKQRVRDVAFDPQTGALVFSTGEGAVQILEKTKD